MSPISRTETPLDTEQLKRVLEAILFAHDGPVTIDMLGEALPAENADAIREALDALGRDYQQAGHAFEILRIAGGYQICTREMYASWVVRFQRGSRKARLSRAAVETLAIIAYRQPVTRSEMEEIRGVDSGAVLHTLLERNLITVRGRSRGIGRPLLYATTGEFLEYFGLDRLEDLPRLDEIESLLKEREELPEELLGLEDIESPPGEGTGTDALATAPPAPIESQLAETTDPDLEEPLDGLEDDERTEVTAGPGLYRVPANAGGRESSMTDPRPAGVSLAPDDQEEMDDAAIELERLD